MASRLALRTLLQSTRQTQPTLNNRLVQGTQKCCNNILIRGCATTPQKPADYHKVTGIEKRELDQRLSGNADPFKMSTAIRTGPKGTKENPIMVPSMMEERIVGCTCDEDSPQINWIVIKQNEMKRCVCGNAFKVYKAPPTDVWGEAH